MSRSLACRCSGQLVRDTVAEAMTGPRAKSENAPDDTLRAIQEARHRDLEASV